MAVAVEMKQAIAGVAPPELGEVTIMTVWPSIGALGLGRWIGRMCGIRWPHRFFNPSAGGVLCASDKLPGSATPATETVRLLGALLVGDWPVVHAGASAVRLTPSSSPISRTTTGSPTRSTTRPSSRGTRTP